jgi:hypothetical protein
MSTGFAALGRRLFYHADVVAIEQNLWQLDVALRRITDHFVSLQWYVVRMMPLIMQRTSLSRLLEPCLRAH